MKRLLLTSLPLLAAVASAASLEDTFRTPPRDAKPHTWYHMMNGNVTKEGITCDFEALAKVGIGGVQMFDAGCDIPAGGLDFNSPEWFDLFRHAASEARRLGLEICIPNCSGWSSSGGPWNPPENGMKNVVFSETKVTGPKKFAGVLPREKNDHGYYADIAVMAVPAREPEKLATSRHEDAGGELVEEYPEAIELGGMYIDFSISGWMWTASVAVELSTSEDGKTFVPAAPAKITLASSGTTDPGIKYLDFGGVRKVKAVRAKVKGMTGVNTGKSKVAVAGFGGCRTAMFTGLSAKSFAKRIEMKPVLAPADAMSVAASEVRDLSSLMKADGSVEWDVPAGDWRILRIGAICNGRRNHPASDHGIGLEVDKLSAKAMDYHFEQYVARLCRHLGPLAGAVETGFNNILVDSYEVGSQNWTQDMEAEFLLRRGYSMRPYLPILAGVVIGSPEITERFLEDFRRTVADLFADNYAGALAKKCHEYGLKLSLEPYGNCPSDNLQYGREVDIPMGEFWSHAGGGDFATGCGNARYVSYLAHFWGRKYCATESFTADPGGGGRWRTVPFTIKAQGDQAYASGVNRIIYHRFTHQPWPGKRYVPGMTMGRWGMHMDRNQTWWDYSRPWFEYQTRTQAMLQRGTFRADVLFFCGEEAPNQGGNTDGGSATKYKDLGGYAWDVCSADAIPALEVDGRGRLVSPGKVAYRVLVLPEGEAMTPAMLERFLALADRGARICGTVRPVRAPGLACGKDGDLKVRQLAEKLWNHRNFLACPVAEALGRLGAEPDVVCETKTSDDWHFNWIHRGENDAEWYFVCAANRKEAELEVSLRGTGRVPELWDAEKGTLADAGVWREENGRTYVTVPLAISGSKFIVLRRPSAGVRHVVSAKGEFAPVKPVVAKEDAPVFRRVIYGVIKDGAGVEGKSVDVTALCNAAVKDGLFNETLSNRFFKADPARNTPKQVLVEYRACGKDYSRTIGEGSRLSIPETAAETLAFGLDAKEVTASRSGSVEFVWNDGKKEVRRFEVPAPKLVEGPWEVEFPHAFAPNGTVWAEGAAEKVAFPRLINWIDSENEGVRYFSGTAIYRRKVNVEATGGRVWLDLGNVKKVAEVTVNGKTYPALWRPPYRVDITDAVRGGSAALEIKVANLWANRLIGDDRTKAPDCEWKGSKNASGVKEIGVKAIPEWVKRGEKSPSGRFTFTTWQHWDKDDPLQDSGLLGPVTLQYAETTGI